jgi:hypothetical protein
VASTTQAEGFRGGVPCDIIILSTYIYHKSSVIYMRRCKYGEEYQRRKQREIHEFGRPLYVPEILVTCDFRLKIVRLLAKNAGIGRNNPPLSFDFPALYHHLLPLHILLQPPFTSVRVNHVMKSRDVMNINVVERSILTGIEYCTFWFRSVVEMTRHQLLLQPPKGTICCEVGKSVAR